jgi:hypothetical protein
MEGLHVEVVDTGSLNYQRESQSLPTLVSLRLGSLTEQNQGACLRWTEQNQGACLRWCIIFS